MARLGCLLMILAIGGLVALVVLPVLPSFENNATIDNLLTPVVCEPGERIERDQYTTSGNRGGTIFTMSVDCVAANGERRDATDRWTLLSLGAFLAPFLIGLFLIIGGISRTARSAVARQITLTGQRAGEIGPDWLEGIKVGGSASQSAGGKSLADRLKQAQEARDKGLITIQEYERLRQEILDEV